MKIGRLGHQAMAWLALSYAAVSVAGCRQRPPLTEPLSSTLYSASFLGSVYTSPDGGASWESLTDSDDALKAQFKTLAVLADGSVLVGTPVSGLLEIDAAGHCRSASEDLKTSDIRCILPSPGSPDRVYVGTMDRGVLASDDGGHHWVPVNRGLSCLEVHDLKPSATQGERIICATYAGIFASRDPAAGWQRLPTPAADFDFRCLATEAGSRGLLYAGLGDVPGGDRLLVSHDGGASWTPAAHGLPKAHILAVCVNPAVPGAAYAGTTQGVYVSSDAGGHWKPLGSELKRVRVYALRKDAFALYAATSEGAFRRLDGARQWQAISAGLPASGVTDVVVAAAGPRTSP